MDALVMLPPFCVSHALFPFAFEDLMLLSLSSLFPLPPKRKENMYLCFLYLDGGVEMYLMECVGCLFWDEYSRGIGKEKV